MNITPEKLRRYAETCEGSTKIVLLAAASTIEDLQKERSVIISHIWQMAVKHNLCMFCSHVGNRSHQACKKCSSNHGHDYNYTYLGIPKGERE